MCIFKKILKKLQFNAVMPLIGVLCCFGAGYWRMHGALQPPAQPVKINANMIGMVHGLPSVAHYHRRQWHVAGTTYDDHHNVLPYRTLLLNIPETWAMLPGMQWHFKIQLKPAHHLCNPGNCYPWLWLNGIDATGTVISGVMDRMKPSWLDRVDYLRLRIMQAIQNTPLQHGSLITALTIGDTQTITAPDWQLFRITGTSHLMAISGLHIGLISGACHAMITWLWSRLGWADSIAAPRVGALAGMLSAWCYTILSGLSLPSQRACIMLTIFWLSKWFKRVINPWLLYHISLITVLNWSPASLVSHGFWLSFGAVAILLYTKTSHVGIKKWLHPQYAITIGLMPICLMAFGSISVIGWMANIIAIPWFSMVTVPLSLLGMLTYHYTTWLWQLADISVTGMHLILTALEKVPMWTPLSDPLACIGMALWAWLLLSPMPHRALSWIGLIPAIWMHKGPPIGSVHVSVLDVGQGLSVVLRTHAHTLVYDTGPGSPTWNTGSSIVWPYLHHLGVRTIDGLIVSHGDNDHNGGTDGLLQLTHPRWVKTSVPERIPMVSTLCQAGQSWRWDGVLFQIVHPSRASHFTKNNGSCVLYVTTRLKHTILLPGDIERLAESHLPPLPTTLLIAPHHGSRTSSTYHFVQQTHPQYVVFSTGWCNRYHFPHANVVKRYQAIHAIMHNTATQGAFVQTLL
jgi:competence protein ComEC